MQRDKEMVPWVKQDSVWERVTWALNEKGQRITRTFDRLAPG